MRRIIILIILSGFICPNLLAQRSDKNKGSIAINRDDRYNEMSPEELVKDIFLKPQNCTQIKNVRVRVLGWDTLSHTWNSPKELRGVGYFHKADSDFPIQEGLIMSTANVTRIEGPNKTDLGLGNVNSDVSHLIGDYDLKKLVGNEVGRNIYDVSVIEFDFTAASSSVSFNYIFASEEYPSNVNFQFNDAFAFFIYNKNDTTYKPNIALLPETLTGKDVVSINNVNDGRWTDFTWSTPVIGHNQSNNPRFFVRQPENTLATEFNGYTYDKQNKKTLEAKFTNLIVCDEYHIKLIVGNMQDQGSGSGVFLEAHSFTMGPRLQIISNNIENPETVYSKCNSNIRVRLLTSEKDDWNVNLTYSGLANGTDVTKPDGTPLPQSVTIPAGEMYIDIPFVISETAANNSTFKVSMQMNCVCNISSVAKDEISVIVKNDYPVFKISRNLPCTPTESGSIIIETIQGNSTGYQYSKDGGMTWQDSNIFNNLARGTYNIKMRHLESCYENAQPIEVRIIVFAANAGTDIAQCNTVFTMNANSPEGNDTGVWTVVSPLDGITISNPLQYNTSVTMDLSKTTTATLRWTLSSSTCSSSDEVVINYQPCSFPVNPHLRSRFK